MTFNTILTVGNDDLSRLNPQEAVEFFRELLWAEASRVGIPLNKINVSSRVNVADGGVDATVTDAIITSGNEIIVSGHNSYQIKTGTAFEPWQDSAIKKELFGTNEPNRDNLGLAVKACLEAKGRYVIVCFGQDLVGEQPNAVRKHLENYFKLCGYDDINVDVWSANKLIGFLKIFPSLALRVNRRGLGRFELHNQWANNDDMQQPFVVSDDNQKIIDGIQAVLRLNSPSTHIRILGEPGIGKTRIILEATRPDDLSALAIYTYASDFRDTDLMQELLRGEFDAIVVLDECDPDSRSYIWNRFKNNCPNVKLLTIYNEFETTTGLSYFEITGLEDEAISQIIQTYNVPRLNANRLAQLCSGSPRVAHMIGSNSIAYPDDLLRDLSTVNIWDRYILGPNRSNPSHVAQRTTVLRYIALFKRFGYGTLVQSEAKEIAALIQRHDQTITWLRFQEIVSELRNQKILQGENTLYITPKALHTKLWLDWWQTHGIGFDLSPILSLPNPLLVCFFEMFEYATGSEVASNVARNLLGEDGPFQQDHELLKSRLGAFFFRYLSKADPASAIRCLQLTIGQWSRDETLEFTEGRREIVRALVEMAQWGVHFENAALLLLQLAESENESWTNNASGSFADLFSLSLHKDLSETEAPPLVRFPVIKMAFESDSGERQDLALKACEKWLSPKNFGAINSEVRIVGKKPDLWIPKTWGELFDAYRLVWTYLEDRINQASTKKTRVARILTNSAPQLVKFENLQSLIINTFQSISQKQIIGKRELLETILSIIRYSLANATEERKRPWIELQDAITGLDYHSLLERYVGMSIPDDNFDPEGKRTTVTKDIVERLAQEGLNNPSLLVSEVEWLVSSEIQNGYTFGFEVAKRDTGFTFLPKILAAQKTAPDNTSALFLAGYLRLIFDTDKDLWDTTMESLAVDIKLSGWIPELSARVGPISNKAGLRVLDVIVDGRADARSFAYFIYGNGTSNLSNFIFQQWIEYLVSQTDGNLVGIAISLFDAFYIRRSHNLQLPEDLTLRLITHPLLFGDSKSRQNNQMSSYNWEEISSIYIRQYPQRSLEIADIVLEHFGDESGLLGYHREYSHRILGMIAQSNLSEAWEKITKYLNGPLDTKAFYITHWLRGDLAEEEYASPGMLSIFPRELIWKWVDEDIENRAGYLASFVPPKIDSTSIAREMLSKYGDRDDVRLNLNASYSSGMWSGPESAYLTNRKQKLLAHKEIESDRNVKAWIDEYVARLDKQIEHARIEEERESY